MKRTLCFVLFLDNSIEKGISHSEEKSLAGFIAQNRCVLISEYKNQIESRYPEIICCIPWKFNLPTPELQRWLLIEHDVRMEETVYVSDDSTFIGNALGSLSKTVFIGSMDMSSCYGRVPDLTCKSIESFINAINSGHYLFLGEGIVATPKSDSVTGGFGLASKDCSGRRVDVVFLGRYYGTDHFRSALDLYSLALRLNKNQKSKLYRKFDGLFQRIFLGGVRLMLKLKMCDSLCAVPDNRTDGLSGGRFAEMVEEIASCGLGLENLQPHVHRKRSKHQSQKTIDTALARQSNIKGSFCCDSSLRGKNIVVLDDILTTGATLKEFASTLFEAGAESVSCVVLAVNQFAEEYWYQSHELKEFVDNNKLRINSKTLEPFFSRDGKSFDFISSIENLFGKLNQEIGEERQECFASDDFTF